MLQLQGISKTFDTDSRAIPVLAGVQLEIKSGERVAILGRSGSGKSTLLGIMAGLDRPTAGRVLLDGVDLAAQSENELAELRARSIGYVFQSFELVAGLTALENVLLPSLIASKPDPARAAWLLEKVGLKDRADSFASRLSGGEMQRVALARALMNRPRIIFADEPTGSLDQATGESVFQLVLDLAAESGAALVVITHDPELANRLDRRVVLEAGSLRPAL